MTALAGMSGWIAGGAIVAAVSVVAVGSLVLRETSRARIAATPSTAAAKPAARPADVAQSAAPRPTHAPAPSVSVDPAKPEPAFDVVRVEPGGAAVVAGHGAPKLKMVLLDGGRVVEQVESDAEGQFVFTPAPLSPGPHVLSLAPAGGVPGKSVRVNVRPALATGRPAAAATPKPERTPPAAVALGRAPPDASPGSPASVIAFRSLEIEKGGAFVVTGSGAAGHVLRVYLNGSFVVAVRPQADGSWSVRVEKGMLPGRYELRADDVRGRDAAVLATAGTSFEYAGSGSAGAAKPAMLDDPGKAASPSPAPEETASTSPGPAASPPGPNLAPLPALPAGPPTPAATPADAVPASRATQVIAAVEPPAPLSAVRSPAPHMARFAAPASRAPIGKVTRPPPAPRASVAPVTVARVRPAPTLVQRPPLGQHLATTMRTGYGKVAISPKAAAAMTRPAPQPYRVVVVTTPALAYGGASIRYGPLIPARPFAPVPPAARMAVGTWQAIVPAPRRPARPPAHAVVPTIRTVVVQPGDSLWRISERAYGSGSDFLRVVQANPAVIRNPQVIVTGQRLVLPSASARFGPAR